MDKEWEKDGRGGSEREEETHIMLLSINLEGGPFSLVLVLFLGRGAVGVMTTGDYENE